MLQEAVLQESKYLSPKKVAFRYSVSRQCINIWKREKKIPAPVTVNGRPRWRLEDLEAWDLSHK